MEPDSTIDPDGNAYGELLGDYFTVASEIAELQAQSGEGSLEQPSRYQELANELDALQNALDELERTRSTADIKTVLDRALPSA